MSDRFVRALVSRLVLPLLLVSGCGRAPATTEGRFVTEVQFQPPPDATSWSLLHPEVLQGTPLVAASDGTVYSAVAFRGQLLFGSQTLGSATSTTSLLLRLTPTGELSVVARATNVAFHAVAATSNGNFVVVAGFPPIDVSHPAPTSVDLGAGSVALPAGTADASFVIGYTGSGGVRWVRQATSLTENAAPSLDLVTSDGTGRVLVAGTASALSALCPTTAAGPSTDLPMGFACRFDDSGAPVDGARLDLGAGAYASAAWAFTDAGTGNLHLVVAGNFAAVNTGQGPISSGCTYACAALAAASYTGSWAPRWVKIHASLPPLHVVHAGGDRLYALVDPAGTDTSYRVSHQTRVLALEGGEIAWTRTTSTESSSSSTPHATGDATPYAIGLSSDGDVIVQLGVQQRAFLAPGLFVEEYSSGSGYLARYDASGELVGAARTGAHLQSIVSDSSGRLTLGSIPLGDKALYDLAPSGGPTTLTKSGLAFVGFLWP